VALFDNDPRVRPPFEDVPLFHGRAGFEQWWGSEGCHLGNVGCLAAIGGSRGRDRLDSQAFLEEKGLSPITIVHPTAFVAKSASLGKGSQILAKAAVTVNCRLGAACIVNTNATIDHDTVLGDGVHVAPGATVTGEVQVGSFAMIGAGAVVLPQIEIGENAIVGAGSVVTKNVESHTIVVGIPAKVMKRHDYKA